MPAELESRLERLLAGGGPDGDAGARALRRALAALPEPRRHGLRTALFVTAAAIAVATVSAAALAAAGAIHVGLGARGPAARAVTQPRLALPPGASGIAAVVGGRLWLTTRSGLRIEGLPVDAAALSPHALYVAAGLGNALVAMAPDGRRAWSHTTPGKVVAIAWSPSGLRIAYVVRAGKQLQLRLIEGDGDRDQLVDASVRPVRPAWRGDSLAVRYAGAGGRATVYDLARGAHRLLGTAAPHSAVVDAPPSLRVEVSETGIAAAGLTLLRARGVEHVDVR